MLLHSLGQFSNCAHHWTCKAAVFYLEICFWGGGEGTGKARGGGGGGGGMCEGGKGVKKRD